MPKEDEDEEKFRQFLASLKIDGKLNYVEASKRFQITQKRIKEIEAKALRKLRGKNGDAPDNEDPVDA